MTKFDLLKRLFKRLWALESELKLNEQILAQAKARSESCRKSVKDLETALCEMLGP
jgi:hypothetical protein